MQQVPDPNPAQEGIQKALSSNWKLYHNFKNAGMNWVYQCILFLDLADGNIAPHTCKCCFVEQRLKMFAQKKWVIIYVPHILSNKQCFQGGIAGDRLTFILIFNNDEIQQTCIICRFDSINAYTHEQKEPEITGEQMSFLTLDTRWTLYHSCKNINAVYLNTIRYVLAKQNDFKQCPGIVSRAQFIEQYLSQFKAKHWLVFFFNDYSNQADINLKKKLALLIKRVHGGYSLQTTLKNNLYQFLNQTDCLFNSLRYKYFNDLLVNQMIEFVKSGQN